MTRRIILADDHTILRQGVRAILDAEEDLEVVGEAKDGDEAVQLTRQLKPDLVVMDITMPKMSGIEATKTLRLEFPDLPVLILTMHEEPEFIFAMLDAGANGYVLKETAARELVSAIRAVLEGGSVLYPSVARRIVQEAARGRHKDSSDSTLTPREVEVLKLVAQGRTNREIADKLFLSVKTVETHRTHIMEKLGVHDRVELVKYAIRTGLIDLTQ